MATTTATFRGDIQTMLMEGGDAESLLIGDKILPIYNVPEKTGEFPKFELAKGKRLDSVSTKRNADGTANRIRREYTNDTYACTEYVLEELVSDEYRADVDRFFDAEVTAARMTRHNVFLGHEERVADAVLNASTFNATAASVNYTETLIATINFAKDLQAAIQRLEDKAVMPNAIVMSSTLRNQIARSTLFQNFVKPFQADVSVITNDTFERIMRDAFGLNLYVGRASKQASLVRGTYTAEKIWSNDYIFVGKISEGDPMLGGVGRTFNWNSYIPAPFAVESYRDEQRKSDVIRVSASLDEEIIDSTAGELITTNYSAT